MAKTPKKAASTPLKLPDRAERVRLGGDKHIIDTWLSVAEGKVWPTRPDIDEPRKDAERRRETVRVNLTRLMLAIYKDQLRDGNVDERLQRFFERVWSAPDPVEAMRQFLGLPKRGARKTKAAQHFFLAVEIQKWIDALNDGPAAERPRSVVDEACGKVFDQIQGTQDELDIQYLRKIYYRETKHAVDKAAIRATIETRKLDRSLAAAHLDDDPPERWGSPEDVADLLKSHARMTGCKTATPHRDSE